MELFDKVAVITGAGSGIGRALALKFAAEGARFVVCTDLNGENAIETADIALMTDDLAKLPWLVGHSRRTLAIIRENIVFSLGVKVVFVVLTFAGFATLWGAIAADVGASLLVVANALRLLRQGPTEEGRRHLEEAVERAAAERVLHGH